MFVYRFKHSLIALVGLAALALSAPAPARAQLLGPQKVVVTNTASNPVPTVAQGTTTVAGTVQAQQAGAWSVGLDPSQNTVRVGNTEADPVPVANVNDARQPFQRFFSLNATDFPNALGSFQVPSGKRLVIEYASFRGEKPQGQILELVIQTTVNSVLAPHFLTPSPVGAMGTSEFFTASQQMRVYADPGTSVGVFIQRFAGPFTGNISAGVSISGYLVDAPPQSQQ